jgi:Ca-activated chloride channel homolog
VTALYELIPAGSDEKVPSVDPLKYQHTVNTVKTDNGYRNEYLTIKIRYKKPDGITSMMFEKPVRDYVNDLEDASDNLRFAAAVAEFGMIIRNSEFKGNSTPEEAIELAKSARGRDDEGYRAEFIRLMGSAKGLKRPADKDL